MSDENKARLAHDVLDGLSAGRILSRENEQLLRSFLPEMPKQKTLAEIASDVYIAWYDTIGSDWDKESYGDLDAWLHELHTHLIEIEDTPAAAPALPEGMRLAEHEKRGRVVVSPKPNDIGQCKIFHLDDSYVSGADVSYVEADALTFIDAEPALKPPFQKAMSYQVARLQAAVKEMLADINVDAAEKLSGFDGCDGQDVVSIEDYGLTQEDME